MKSDKKKNKKVPIYADTGSNKTKNMDVKKFDAKSFDYKIRRFRHCHTDRYNIEVSQK